METYHSAKRAYGTGKQVFGGARVAGGASVRGFQAGARGVRSAYGKAKAYKESPHYGSWKSKLKGKVFGEEKKLFED